MISKSRALAFLGTSAICIALIAPPTRVADSQFTRWMHAFGTLGEDLRASFQPDQEAPSEARSAAALEQKTADAVSDADDQAPSPSSEEQATAQDGLNLKDAYKVRLADDKIKSLGIEPAGILEAIAAYRGGRIEAGDAIAAKIDNPLVKTALEWVALREAPMRIGMSRLQTFASTHDNWPAAPWLRHQMESRLVHSHDPIAVLTFFTTQAPETALGKLALASALKATGRIADGSKLARAVFRESDLNAYTDNVLRSEFGSDLTRGDYKYRADRLLYKEKVSQAMPYAARAGSDVLAVAKARAAVIAQGASDNAFAAVPESMRGDPLLVLAEAQKLRRSDKLLEAAKLIESAPHNAAQLVDGDEWWTERRVLARKLLDAGKTNAAYVMCAMNAAVSKDAKVEAEFHAGWIALRFMNEPARAAYHFNRAATFVNGPSSDARIAYWQGRTAEQSSDPTELAKAKAYYERAASHGSTYYGQLARQVIGATDDLVQEPTHRAVGDERAEAVRAIELLYAAGAKDAAFALATQAAENLDDGRQVAALAAVIAKEQDAHLALTVGKMINQHNHPVDPLAFPTGGIPAYEALANSADPAVVYAVARQESTFLPTVVSKAGARGLMQMIDGTAQRTAAKAGLPFSPGRMLSDPSFNARLGAAHLGELIADQDGSLILTFAAYNAGPGRVKQWIEAYGDPRKPGVDPVDWVERIPFTETRNYVQKVSANVGMYRAILANQAKVAARRALHREAKL